MWSALREHWSYFVRPPEQEVSLCLNRLGRCAHARAVDATSHLGYASGHEAYLTALDVWRCALSKGGMQNWQAWSVGLLRDWGA